MQPIFQKVAKGHISVITERSIKPSKDFSTD